MSKRSSSPPQQRVLRGLDDRPSERANVSASSTNLTPARSANRSALSDAQQKVAPTAASQLSQLELLMQDDQLVSQLNATNERRMNNMRTVLAQREAKIEEQAAYIRRLQDDYRHNYDVATEDQETLAQLYNHKQILEKRLEESAEKEKTAESELHAALNRIDDMKKNIAELQRAKEEEIDAVHRRMDELDLMHADDLRRKEEDVATRLEDMQEHVTQRIEAEQRMKEDAIKRIEHKLRETEHAFGRERETLKMSAQRSQEQEQEQRSLLQQVEDELIAARQRADDAEARVEDLRSRLEDESRRFAEAKRSQEQRASQSEQSLLDLRGSMQSTLREDADRIATLESELSQSKTTEGIQQQRITLLQQQLEAEQARLKDQGTSHQSTFTQMLKAKDEHINQVELKEQKAQMCLDEERRLHNHSKLDLQQTQTQLEAVKDRASQLEREVRSLQEERLSLRGEISQLQRTVSDLKGEEMRAKAERDTISHGSDLRVSELTDQLSRAKQDKINNEQRLETELARVRRELHKSEAARTVLEDQLTSFQYKDWQSTIETLRQEKAGFEVQVSKLEDENKRVRKDMREMENAIENDPLIVNARVNADRVAQLEKKFSDAQAELLQRSQHIASLEREVRDLRQDDSAKDETYRESLAKLAGEGEQLRDALEAERRHQRQIAALDNNGADSIHSPQQESRLLREISKLRSQLDVQQKQVQEATTQRAEAVSKVKHLTAVSESLASERDNLIELNSRMRHEARRAATNSSASALLQSSSPIGKTEAGQSQPRPARSAGMNSSQFPGASMTTGGDGGVDNSWAAAPKQTPAAVARNLSNVLNATSVSAAPTQRGSSFSARRSPPGSNYSQLPESIQGTRAPSLSAPSAAASSSSVPRSQHLTNRQGSILARNYALGER